MREKNNDVTLMWLKNNVVTINVFLDIYIYIISIHSWSQVRMAMGRGEAEEWDLRPGPTWTFLAPSSHDGENFLPHPRPLRPHEDPRSPAPPRKTLFLINFPYNYYHFFK